MPTSATSDLVLHDGSQTIDATPYRKLVGGLIYLPITRLQIYACSYCKSWVVLKHIMRYFKGTIHYGLFLHKNSPL